MQEVAAAAAGGAVGFDHLGQALRPVYAVGEVWPALGDEVGEDVDEALAAGAGGGGGAVVPFVVGEEGFQLQAQALDV